MSALNGLEPQKVFAFFEELSAIPRGSGNTAAVSDWLSSFAGTRQLICIRDGYGNVVIKKDGQAGGEKAEPVILQGHMDMVAVKTADSGHDFTKDPLKLRTDGDELFAEGTSLGGDDGIAVAYMLALLDSDELAYPPLECVFTTDEEIGMLGADAMDMSVLSGKRMVNLDSEEEGIMTCGCAGGATVEIELPLTRIPMSGLKLSISVEGLLGGHSGVTITEGRANALKLLGRLLIAASEEFGCSLISVNGGTKDNVIPSEAIAELMIDPEDLKSFEQFAKRFEREAAEEYEGVEHGLSVMIREAANGTERVLDFESGERALNLLLLAPHGVRKMSGTLPGLAETSSNCAIAQTKEHIFSLTSSVRSSFGFAKEAFLMEYEALAKLVSGSCTVSGVYPGWAFRADSPLRDNMTALYRELTGKEPVVDVVHAGLECGIFAERIPGLDAVSIGPDMQEIHSTGERLSISSVQRVWDYLTKLLIRLCETS